MKPGIKTTEFYLTLIAAIGSFLAGLEGIIDPSLAAKLVAANAAVYSFVRAITKAFSSNV